VVEDYLQKLSETLTAQCGKEKSKTILAEVRDHLDQAIEELVGRGLSRQEAEKTAVSRFGDAAAVCRWYADQHRRPSVWRASRWPLVASAATTVLWHFQNDIFPSYFLAKFGALIVINTMLALTAVLCYRSKRFTAGPITLSALGLFLLLVGSFCLFSVPIFGEYGYGVIARSSVDSEIERARQMLARSERNLQTFGQGQKVFASKTEPKEGVGQFHDSRGYLTPIYFQTLDPRVHVYIDNKEVNGIVPTYKDARDFWIDQPSRVSTATGKSEIFYIAEATDEAADSRRLIRELPNAASLPLATKLPAFAGTAKWEAIFLLGFGLIADVTGGILRMLVETVQRRRNRGPLTS